MCEVFATKTKVPNLSIFQEDRSGCRCFLFGPDEVVTRSTADLICAGHSGSWVAELDHPGKSWSSLFNKLDHPGKTCPLLSKILTTLVRVVFLFLGNLDSLHSELKITLTQFYFMQESTTG